MQNRSPSRYAGALCVAAVLLAGCGGSQPSSAPGLMPQSHAIATHDHGGSWMLPEAASQDLLYVSDEATVAVYSYPHGKLEGKLRGFFITQGMCVDTKGDVYVADQGYGQVYEYKHGSKKRIKDLGPGDAVDCSLDPTSGDLAATDLQGQGTSGHGNVAIFTNASGNPTYYSAPGFDEYFFCGYDDKGNLFVDGISQPGTGHFIFAELPKGSNTFKDITLNQYIGWPGGIQWDGKYIAIGDQLSPNIYRFAISGTQGTLVGVTPLDGATYVKQTWIQGNRIMAPSEPSGQTGYTLIYKYPGGGTAVKKITGGVHSPQGATVSKAD